MQNTNNLLPGYTLQGFSQVRSQLLLGAERVNNKNQILGLFAAIPVRFLSKVTEYVEIPFRVIEDVALSAINLVGATFNKGCRRNLSHCGKSLVTDLLDSAATVFIVSSSILPIAMAVCHLSLSIGYSIPTSFNDSLKDSPILGYNVDQKKQSDTQLITFYRLKAMRTHGYHHVRACENIASLDSTKVKQPSKTLAIYKRLALTPPEEYEQFQLDLAEKFRFVALDQPEQPGWGCPDELVHDKSEAAGYIRTILNQSYGIDVSKLNRSLTWAHLCKMLGVPAGSSPRKVRNRWSMMVLVLHPDNNNSPYAKEAFDALSAVYDQVRSYK